MMLTGKLFLERGAVKTSPFLKWWAVCALAYMSSVNMYAAIEVYKKATLDAAIITKLMYCSAGLFLLAWVLVFHIDKWKKH
jgi:hypothetical protein